jgi:heterodisulfide reductase subunit C
MDILPHQLMRYVILGDREKVLGSETIWVCIQCMTCSVRCPNGIDVAHVIEGLRRLAAEEHGEAGRDSWEFDKSFLDSVRRRGS